MAGYVSGTIGTNDVLLKNMATEETLDLILETLKTVSITKDDGNKARVEKDNSDAKKDNTKKIKEGTGEFGKFMDALGASSKRLIRGFDSNINDASWSFQVLGRENNKFGKAMQFAGNSVMAMQEQFAAYGKMMQVGGVIAEDFGTLRERAVGLGTDLSGLSRYVEEYSFSLKSGVGSVREGLNSLNTVFTKTLDSKELVAQWGRLGIGTNKITEQMLLASEAQGGYNAVFQRYGKSPEAFSKGMLKSTQDLTVFASALGMNSRLMQEEAAKANQKIQNRLFVQSLSKEQRDQLTMYQALTGSYDTGVALLRSEVHGYTNEIAGAFNSLKGITGMGEEIDKAQELIRKGSTDLGQVLIDSGMADKVKKMSKEQIARMTTEFEAYAPEIQTVMAPLLSVIGGLQGTDAKSVKDAVANLTQVSGENAKTIDGYSNLLMEQNFLARSTAALNTQINRLGLSMALGGTKIVKEGVDLGKGAKDTVREYLNQVLPEGIKLPDNIFDKVNTKLEQGIDSQIEAMMREAFTFARNAIDENGGGGSNTVTLNKSSLSRTTAMNVKKSGGGTVYKNAAELLTNPEARKGTVYEGPNTTDSAVAAGALFQNRVSSVGPITGAGEKFHHKGPYGAIDLVPKGGTNDAVYKGTIDAMKKVMTEMDLKEGVDYYIKNEMMKSGDKWTAPHIHFEFKNQKAADAIRDTVKQQLKVEADKKDDADKDKKKDDKQAQLPVVSDTRIASVDPEKQLNNGQAFDYEKNAEAQYRYTKQSNDAVIAAIDSLGVKIDRAIS